MIHSAHSSLRTTATVSSRKASASSAARSGPSSGTRRDLTKPGSGTLAKMATIASRINILMIAEDARKDAKRMRNGVLYRGRWRQSVLAGLWIPPAEPAEEMGIGFIGKDVELDACNAVRIGPCNPAFAAD